MSLRFIHRGPDKSLARPGRKQARKHVRDSRDFNKIEMQAVIKFLFLQGKAPKEIHAVLTETLVCFLPGWAENVSAPLYTSSYYRILQMLSFDITCLLLLLLLLLHRSSTQKLLMVYFITSWLIQGQCLQAGYSRFLAHSF